MVSQHNYMMQYDIHRPCLLYINSVVKLNRVVNTQIYIRMRIRALLIFCGQNYWC